MAVWHTRIYADPQSLIFKIQPRIVGLYANIYSTDVPLRNYSVILGPTVTLLLSHFSCKMTVHIWNMCCYGLLVIPTLANMFYV